MRKGSCLSSAQPTLYGKSVCTLAFQSITAFVHWASLVDAEAPGLRPLLSYSRTQRGGCLVYLVLRDGTPLVPDGLDVLRAAARRAGCLRAVAA
jgi:hypothetical protein